MFHREWWSSARRARVTVIGVLFLFLLTAPPVNGDQRTDGRIRLSAHRGPIRALAISPDGQTLASASWGAVFTWDLSQLKATQLFGSEDNALLVWDMAPVTNKGRPRSATIDAEHFKKLWAALAGSDAASAFRAMGIMLAADSTQLVAFLGERLHPVKAADPDEVRRLAANLDDRRFEVREKATRELEKLGELALPVLRSTLADKPSLEARRRVEELLRRLDTFALSGQALASWRALEVLERVNTPEARQLLEKLSRGAPGARQTEEAKAALERLAKRP